MSPEAKMKYADNSFPLQTQKRLTGTISTPEGTSSTVDDREISKNDVQLGYLEYTPIAARGAQRLQFFFMYFGPFFLSSRAEAKTARFGHPRNHQIL